MYDTISCVVFIPPSKSPEVAVIYHMLKFIFVESYELSLAI